MERRVEEAVDLTGFNIKKLAYAVSMAETSGFTKWYWVTHNNWYWIKHWNTAPCPGVPKLVMCKFDTKQQSTEAFIKIWSKWYWRFPDYNMAYKWTWWDRTMNWLNTVTYYYNK